jgi:hypothetical protein
MELTHGIGEMSGNLLVIQFQRDGSLEIKDPNELRPTVEVRLRFLNLISVVVSADG